MSFKILGLIGYPLSHSFSKKYFGNKFKTEEIKNWTYENFEIQSIRDFRQVVLKQKQVVGLNVTIPHKEKIIPILHELDPVTSNIRAVNTIKISKDGYLKGFNTDVIGFENSLTPLISDHMQKALILGTGGASNAVKYVLDKLGIGSLKVSSSGKGDISYQELKPIIHSYHIIINTTPLGTHPNINTCPSLPYDEISQKHLLYDLVYNPEKTLFLKHGESRGALIKNGHEMLILQAEASWKIWNE
jgi:shikimate dehydrogenase